MKLADEWVKAGKPCTFRYGFAYRGASAKRISPAKASELIKTHSFGMGFYTMHWRDFEGERVLEFNELDANDLC